MELAVAFTPSVSVTRPRHNLPVPLTSLVGREREYNALINHFVDSTYRLITITGVGGVGKTRLAIEAARAVAPVGNRISPFSDGVFLVSLALLTDQSSLEDALAATIAATLGLILSGPDPVRVQVRNFLSEKSILLVLDNLEQLISGAPLVAWLLETAPRLRILATSRVPLGVRGEWVMALDGLGYPPSDSIETPDPAEYGAIDLFLRIVQASAPGMTFGGSDIAAIARICRMVGGLPLGIELAASWARFMSCREIADEIAHSLDFLSTAGPDVPDRHQSMRAVFSSSWVLLTEAEQRAVRRLAIFVGSFTRVAAADVCEITLPMLATLVSKSLVRRLVGAEGAETRYTLPESLRPYAAHELGASREGQALADRHADYYLAELAAYTEDLRGPRQPEALAALTAEIAQIRSAWRQVVARGDAERIGRAADALFHIYNMRSWFAEGADAFGAARTALTTGAELHAVVRVIWGRLLAREGWFIFHLGRQQEARMLLERSLHSLRDGGAPTDLIWSLNYLGAVCGYLGDFAATERLCRESLVLAEQHGDLYGRVIGLSVLCQTAYDQGDYASARIWGEESLAMERRIGSVWSMAYSLANLGKVAAALGDNQRAQQVFMQALEIRRSLGDSRGAAICLNRMGVASAKLGNLRDAFDRYRESLALFREIGNRWGIASALLNLGHLAFERRVDRAAARLFGEALALALETDSKPQVEVAMKAIIQLVERSGDWAPADRALVRGTTTIAAPLETDTALNWASFYGAMLLDQAFTEIAIALAQPDSQVALPSQPATHGVSIPAGLTTRELEVLQLVAAGLTDAQVAERLIISRRTVNAHLGSIYSKIGVNSRSAATRFAIEHGLTTINLNG